MPHDLDGMTFGAELEIGDVLRSRSIPEHLGIWNPAETDVVNVHPPYRGIAADPLGINPPYGGEVNMRPCRTAQQLADNIAELYDWFRAQGDQPSFTALNASHVHVRVPGLKDDIVGLHRLQKYVGDWQKFLVEHQYKRGYVPPRMTPETRKAHMVPLDGQKLMPDWMVENCLKTTTPEEFYDMQTRGKDGVTRYRIFRYAINTYNMCRPTQTIEFRCFRATQEPVIWHSIIKCAEEFVRAALTTGEALDTIIRQCNMVFPPQIPWDHELMASWVRTMHPYDRRDMDGKWVLQEPVE